jgi:hypothetical protein
MLMKDDPMRLAALVAIAAVAALALTALSSQIVLGGSIAGESYGLPFSFFFQAYQATGCTPCTTVNYSAVVIDYVFWFALSLLAVFVMYHAKTRREKTL